MSTALCWLVNPQVRVEFRYDRASKAAAVLVDGRTLASGQRAWHGPKDGPVTLLSGAHDAPAEAPAGA